MTIIGISLYLVVDNFFYPDRADVHLKNSVLDSIVYLRSAMTDSMDAMRGLLAVAGLHQLRYLGEHLNDQEKNASDHDDRVICAL